MILIGFIQIFGFFVGAFFALTAVFLLEALKFAIFGSLLPAMVTDKTGIGQAFKKSRKLLKQKPGNIYLTYVSTIYFIAVVNVVAGIATFGSALIVTVPASYFFLICEQFVNYYTLEGKKYFLTYEDVKLNPTQGLSEGFISAFEQEKEENDKAVFDELVKEEFPTLVEAETVNEQAESVNESKETEQAENVNVETEKETKE